MPQAFNCSPPDTGNMEVLVKYGTQEQQVNDSVVTVNATSLIQKWLGPSKNGLIREVSTLWKLEIGTAYLRLSFDLFFYLLIFTLI